MQIVAINSASDAASSAGISVGHAFLACSLLSWGLVLALMLWQGRQLHHRNPHPTGRVEPFVTRVTRAPYRADWLLWDGVNTDPETRRAPTRPPAPEPAQAGAVR